MYKEIKGDLIKLARKGNFDVIAHGCNCWCTMGAGIAPQMAKAFGCDKFSMELEGKGDINKLGQIDYKNITLDAKDSPNRLYLNVVNCYTQFNIGRHKKPLDYDALTLCMRKINETFKRGTIGLPKIGAGLAGGSWTKIRNIIRKELIDCNVIVVIYKP